MKAEKEGAERDIDDECLQHQGVGFLAAAGPERTRDRGRDAAPSK
jgi:hypothetical protein